MLEKKLVNKLKIRMMFPFFIDEIHPSYFGIENKNDNDVFKELLLTINYCLDSIHYLKEIVSKTNENYAVLKHEIHDFEIVGNKQSKKQIIFALELNPSHDAFKVVEQIQFNINLDWENKMLLCGFSFNWGNKSQEKSFEEIIKKLYEVNLLSFFIAKEFRDFPISDWDTQSLVLFNDLWSKWLNEKASFDLEMSLNFQSIIKLFMIANIIQAEIKSFFKKSFSNNKLNNTYQTNNYKYKHLLNLNQTVKNNLSLSKPFLSFEIERDSELPFLDEDDDIFLDNDHFKLLYLIMMNPEVFGITDRYSRLVTFKNLINNINAYHDTKNIDKTIDDLVEQTICEWNYDYVTFVNENLATLIVKNNNPIENTRYKEYQEYERDANRKIFNLYFWSIIHINCRIQKLLSIDNNISKLTEKEEKVQTKLLEEQFESIKFGLESGYFTNLAVKKISNKMIEVINIKNFLVKVETKFRNINSKVSLDKRLKNSIYAFLVALVFGLFDYFNTVFTILGESTINEIQVGTSQIVPMIISSIFGLILVITLIYAAYSGGVFLKLKTKLKAKLERRKANDKYQK